jgi:hypothetical protein
MFDIVVPIKYLCFCKDVDNLKVSRFHPTAIIIFLPESHAFRFPAVVRSLTVKWFRDWLRNKTMAGQESRNTANLDAESSVQFSGVRLKSLPSRPIGSYSTYEKPNEVAFTTKPVKCVNRRRTIDNRIHIRFAKSRTDENGYSLSIIRTTCSIALSSEFWASVLVCSPPRFSQVACNNRACDYISIENCDKLFVDDKH